MVCNRVWSEAICLLAGFWSQQETNALLPSRTTWSLGPYPEQPGLRVREGPVEPAWEGRSWQEGPEEVVMLGVKAMRGGVTG